MKQYIGTYRLGSENVRLYLTDKSGAHFAMFDRKNTWEIAVGGDQERWWSVLAGLMHETIEMSYYRHSCRYSQEPDYANDNGNYLFVATHTQFSEVTARAALFISESQFDLKVAWDKFKKKQKK